MKKVVNVISGSVGKLALIGVAVSAGAGRVFAQTFDARTDVSPITPNASLDLIELVSKIVNVILMVVGILAVVYLIYGGIQYITAGGEAEKATKGRTTITNAIIGIIIIVASLAIYNYVLVQTGGSSDSGSYFR